MEELRVEVVERARARWPRRSPRSGVSTARGGGVGARARARASTRGLEETPSGSPPAATHRLVEQRLLRGLEPEPVAQHAQRARVARRRSRARAGRTAAARAGRACRAGHRLGALDHEPHHRLAVAVEHRQRLHDAAHAHDRQQRALLQHAGRAARARARPAARSTRCAARARDLDAPHGAPGSWRVSAAAAPARRALGAQARRAQPPVEAVEQDAVVRARAPDVEREPLGEQRDRAARSSDGGQQQLDRRVRHGGVVFHAAMDGTSPPGVEIERKFLVDRAARRAAGDGRARSSRATWRSPTTASRCGCAGAPGGHADRQVRARRMVRDRGGVRDRRAALRVAVGAHRRPPRRARRGTRSRSGTA